MKEYSYLSWLETVGKQMWFPPDRDAALAELADHMADRREDFIAKGMSGLEASEAVAAVMGDPVEVGRAMNKIHNPVLGWIWQISRILILLILVFGLTQWIWNDRFYMRYMYPEIDRDWDIRGCEYDLAYHLGEDCRRTSIRTGNVEHAGVYTLTLHHGGWVIGEEQQRLTLGFRLKTERVFDLNPIGFSERLCAEDDLGNLYQKQAGGKPVLSCSVDIVKMIEKEWPAPYLHILWDVDDTTPRQWIRFYIPDTDFDITVNAKGVVIG